MLRSKLLEPALGVFPLPASCIEVCKLGRFKLLLSDSFDGTPGELYELLLLFADSFLLMIGLLLYKT